jgi:hypothetical protein
MTYRKLGLSACLVLCVLPTYAQEQTVTPKEIQDTWVGRTLTGTSSSGAPVTMRIQPDGTASVSAGSTSDTGNWRISEQGYCTTWKAIRAGQERCFTAKQVSGRVTVFNPDGSVSGYFTEIK